MKKLLTAAAVACLATAAVLGGAATATATPAQHDAGHTLVAWVIPDQTKADNDQRQTLHDTVAATTVNRDAFTYQCGTRYQLDLYRDVAGNGDLLTDLLAPGYLDPNHDGGFLAYDLAPTPYLVFTTDPCPPVTPPQPAEEVHYGTWVDQHGTPSCDVDTIATHRTVTTKPYILVDGVWIVNTDETTWVTTDEDSTRPKTAEEIKACESTTPPTEEPTTPPTTEPPVTSEPTPTGSPSDEPSEPSTNTPSATPPATVAPNPTSGPTTPSTSPAATVPSPKNSDASGSPRATVTAASPSTTELAYTGADFVWQITTAAALALAGIALLVFGPIRKHYTRQ